MPLRANGQLGFACYIVEPGDDRYRLGAINVLTLRSGQIAQISGFLDPELHGRSGLPLELTDKNLSPDR